PSIAGPKRPQDRIRLTEAKQAFAASIVDYVHVEEQETTGLDAAVEDTFPASDPVSGRTGEPAEPPAEPDLAPASAVPSHRVALELADGTVTELDHGAVVIASITSCTNTSNPS